MASPYLSLSFVFLNSPPPLVSSSLLLPFSVSYIISFFCLLTHDFTWQTQVAISLCKGKQSSLCFSRDSSGPCCIRCLVWFPPPGWEQLPQDMLIICRTARDGLLTSTQKHLFSSRMRHDWLIKIWKLNSFWYLRDILSCVLCRLATNR